MDPQAPNKAIHLVRPDPQLASVPPPPEVRADPANEPVGAREARMGTWCYDPTDPPTQWWSDELYRILGFEIGAVEPSAQAFLRAVRTDDRAAVERLGLPPHAMRNDAADAVHFQITRADSEIRNVRLSAVVAPIGGRSLWIGTVADLTELERVACLLTQANEELHAAQRVAHMGSYATDVTSMQSTWSKALFELLEVDPGDSLSPDLFFDRVHVDDRERARAVFGRILSTGIGAEIELRMQRKDASVWHAYADCKQQIDYRGRAILRGVVQDVTLRKAEDDRRRHAEKMAAIGTLAGGIAHDFNNYLAVLTGELELLRSMLRPDARVKRSLDAVQSAAERCAARTRQLLSLGEQWSTRPRSFDIGELLTKISPMLHSVFSGGRELLIEPPREPVIVRADPIELEHALLNLALNARDALPNGGRFTVSVRLETEEASEGDRRWAVITASDNGTGMDPSTSARAFEPFFSTKGPGKGTGLGLATVYSAMQRIGGKVSFETHPGHGTTFRLHLPLGEQLSGTLPVDESLRNEPPDTRRTILVVEDVAALRSVICRQLEAAGYAVESAADGLAALDILASATRKIDAVISDVMMPVLGGYELEEALRERYPHVRCLLMTGHAPHELDNARAHVALRKPFRAEQLRQAVAALWDDEDRDGYGAL